MNPQYLFSIIIPTFNVEGTIEKCLKSIFEQSFYDYEILIIDGESSDRTLSIVSSFNNPKIKILSEADQGIYDAMNKGITRADGKYLLFLGADDTLFDQQVLKSMSLITTDEVYQIVYGNVKMNGNNNWVKDGTVYGGEFDLRRILSHNIPHQAIFYHYSIFEALGKFNLRYKIFADHDFNIKAFANYIFKYVDLIVANFAIGGASTTMTDSFKSDRIANIIQHFERDLASKRFVPLRYYIQQAAFNPRVKIDFGKKVYLALLYLKLKIQSVFN